MRYPTLCIDGLDRHLSPSEFEALSRFLGWEKWTQTREAERRMYSFLREERWEREVSTRDFFEVLLDFSRHLLESCHDLWLLNGTRIQRAAESGVPGVDRLAEILFETSLGDVCALVPVPNTSSPYDKTLLVKETMLHLLNTIKGAGSRRSEAIHLSRDNAKYLLLAARAYIVNASARLRGNYEAETVLEAVEKALYRGYGIQFVSWEETDPVEGEVTVSAAVETPYVPAQLWSRDRIVRVSQNLDKSVQIKKHYPESDNSPDARAWRLLMDNISKKQRIEFEKHGHITCVGSNTGDKYKVTTDRQMNIFPLTGNLAARFKLCAVTIDPDIPVYDQMLGQIKMIEQDEESFLKIADTWRL